MPYKPLFTTLLGFALAFFHSTSASAQVAIPVKWNFTAKKINSKTYEVHMIANLDNGWRIYAQQPGEGPVPTSVKLTKNPSLVPSGKVIEMGKLIKNFDADFNSELKYYEKTVDFIQKFTLKSKTATAKGTIEYMVRNEHEALPPQKISFSVVLGK